MQAGGQTLADGESQVVGRGEAAARRQAQRYASGVEQA